MVGQCVMFVNHIETKYNHMLDWTLLYEWNYFVIAHSLICDCLLLKDSSFSTKWLCWFSNNVGLVWLTSYHLFGLGDFWDKSSLLLLKIFTIGQFIWNCPPKHVITSTNWTVICSLICWWKEMTTTIYFQAEEDSMCLI